MKSDAERVAIASLLISLAIVGVKFFVAAITGSMVVLAELLDSLGDVLTSSVTWIGVRISRRPPDVKHPYGYAKFDSLLGLLSSFVLVEVGAYIIYRSLSSLLGPVKPPSVVQEALYFLIATSVVNVGRSLALWKTGRSESSKILLSEAVNYGWDAIRTSLVAVVLWISPSIPWIDPLAALVAASIFLPSALKVAYWSANDLLDRIDPSILTGIRDILESCEEVRSVRRARARWVGKSLLIDAVVEVDPSLTAYKTSDILERMANRLRERFSATDVTIAPAIPCREDLAKDIAESVEGVERAHSIEFRNDGRELVIHVALKRGIKGEEALKVIKSVEMSLKGRLNIDEVAISIDEPCGGRNAGDDVRDEMKNY